MVKQGIKVVVKPKKSHPWNVTGYFRNVGTKWDVNNLDEEIKLRSVYNKLANQLRREESED